MVQDCCALALIALGGDAAKEQSSGGSAEADDPDTQHVQDEGPV